MNTNESTYSDYLLIISPPDTVKEVIGKYKRATARVIGVYDGMHGTAHISVTNQHRQMPAMMIQKLGCYQKNISRLQPVTIRINGFHYFTHGSTGVTVYAKIETNSEMSNWFLHLKRIFGDKQKAAVPHITIAKNIPVAKFQLLWPKFIDQQYQESFIPQNITVLSKPMIGGREQHWKVFKELYFNNFVG